MSKCCSTGYTGAMLREPIEFQEASAVSDGAGGYAKSWSAISGTPDRAYVRQLTSSEQWTSSRIEGRSTHMIVTRYTDLINETHIAVIRGREYNLEPPNNVDLRDQWLEIKAKLGKAV